MVFEARLKIFHGVTLELHQLGPLNGYSTSVSSNETILDKVKGSGFQGCTANEGSLAVYLASNEVRTPNPQVAKVDSRL